MTSNQIAMGINSAVYTLCCFAAGIAVGNAGVWKTATLAFAFQFLAGALMEVRDAFGPRVAKFAIATMRLMGIAAGVTAGLMLLF